MRRSFGLLLVGCAALLAGCSDPLSPDALDRVTDSPGDTLFASVVAGSYHSCALTVGGRAYCWGQNDRKQLGTDAAVEQCLRFSATVSCATAPVRVAGDIRFLSLTADPTGDRTCGVTPSGRVFCWGEPLGEHNGATPAAAIPVRPQAATADARFTQVSVGHEQACALDARGRPWCWGKNRNYAAGSPEYGAQLVQPRLVDGGVRLSELHLERGSSCGLATDGAVRCWGVLASGASYAPLLGALQTCSEGPHRSFPCVAAPARVLELPPMAHATGGQCAIAPDGRAWCWATSPPTPVALPERVRHVRVDGGGFRCALGESGALFCAGETIYGQFGDGTVPRSTTDFVPAADGQRFVSFALGASHTCGVTAGGEAYCWGASTVGQLGTGTPPRTCITYSSGSAVSCEPRPVRVASIVARPAGGS